MSLTRRLLLQTAAIGSLSAALVSRTPEPKRIAEPTLFFERSAAASTRKVFPHYFGQLPRSLDNRTAPDYYDASLLRVGGEHGSHAAYGGYLRDRPIYRSPLPGDFELADARWEIQTAQRMGADGFFVNITSLGGDAWRRYTKLVAAASALKSGFVIVPMLDTNGSIRNESAENIAMALGQFVHRPSSYYEQGRFFLSCFKCEGFSPSRWKQIFDAIERRHKIKVKFAGILLNPNRGNIETYAPISSYLGNWMIGADPAMLENTTNTAALAAGWARKAGCGWVGTSHTQINVPYTGHYFDEAANSEALRASWRKIYQQRADHVQCVTWCDFSEGGQLTPSVAKGWSQYAITAYYLDRYKTGSFPTITKDVLFLSHRNQPVRGVSFLSGQLEMMRQTPRSAMTPVRDQVEALTYLTAPADVEVRIGGSVHRYTAPAGEHVQTFPNALGTVSGNIKRKGRLLGQVTSPFTVTARPVSQDRQYFFVSTLHGTADQLHPLVHL